MTSDEIRSMLERQLVRLEKMSETTTHPRALTGMTGSMLAISRRLEQMHALSDDAKKLDSELVKAHQSAIELTKIAENRFGKDGQLYQQAKRVSDNINSVSFRSYLFKSVMRDNGGKDE